MIFRKITSIFVVIFILTITHSLNGQNASISGKALDYANKILVFYTIPDPVIHQKQEIATTRVESDGSFKVNIALIGATEIYSDLEKYCGTMIAEPGKKYTITLPSYSLRTSAEAHSIYFKPTLYWFGLPGTDTEDLNYKVRAFVTDYNNETVKNSVAIYQQHSQTMVADIIQHLEQKYANDRDAYFKTLKMYYYAELEHAVNQRTPEVVIQKYFAKNPLQLSHPVYQRAFESLFTDFLRKQSQDIKNRDLVRITNQGDYNGLIKYFSGKGYSGSFAELVVIKGLNDGFYTGGFEKAGVVKAIEKAKSESTQPQLKQIARQVWEKLSIQSTTSKAPEIKLYNQRDELVNLSRYSGKFIYLTFINTRSKDCRAELDSLVSIEKRLKQILTVVSISTDNEFSSAKQLWKEKGYRWELLNGSTQKELINKLNASIPPVFCLINPNGILQLPQAPYPSRGFEPLFLKIYRDFTFKQQRK